MTTTGRHISEVSSARFEVAVSASLERFKRGSLAFSLSDVIRGARYEDGSSVGETTIYARGLMAIVFMLTSWLRSSLLVHGRERKFPKKGLRALETKRAVNCLVRVSAGNSWSKKVGSRSLSRRWRQ